MWQYIAHSYFFNSTLFGPTSVSAELQRKQMAAKINSPIKFKLCQEMMSISVKLYSTENKRMRYAYFFNCFNQLLCSSSDFCITKHSTTGITNVSIFTITMSKSNLLCRQLLMLKLFYFCIFICLEPEQKSKLALTCGRNLLMDKKKYSLGGFVNYYHL